MDRKILNIVRRALVKESKNMCEQCGSKSMVEGDCTECGYTKENVMEGDMCSECGEGKLVEGECMECGYMEGEMTEKLHGKQYRIDKNKNGRIDGEDFKLLRRKREMKERLYGNQHRIDKNKNNKIDAEDFKMLRKESLTYKLILDESTNEVFYLKENEMINIIENIVLEEKKSKKTKVNNATKSSQERSKKENEDYIKSVTKKMKDYLKMGSKGDYEMDPKHFPKGNGELAKMSKMAYVPSETAQEYIENFTAAGLENLDYDEIHPNEDWVTANLVGSSKTGNNPKWGNAVETEVGERRNKIRKNNLLAKVKRDAYQKDDQPVRYDRTGEDLGDTVDQLLSKYSKKDSKPKQQKTKKNESFVDENKNVINEEINVMKDLFNYNRRTQ
jgi:ribosomal protein L32